MHTSPFADVVGRDGQTLWGQPVGVDEVPDCLPDSCSQAALVGASGRGRDAVHVALDVLGCRVGPHHRDGRFGSFLSPSWSRVSANGVSWTVPACRSVRILLM